MAWMRMMGVDSVEYHRATVLARGDAVAAAIPHDPGLALGDAEARVPDVAQRLQALDKADGWGVLRDTPVGQAAIEWQEAVTERRSSLAQAQHAGLRQRHQLRQRAEQAAGRDGPLRERFETLAGPERARLRAELPAARKLLAELEGQHLAHVRFEIAHPEAFTRLERLEHKIAPASYEMDLGRQGLDGIAPTPEGHPRTRSRASHGGPRHRLRQRPALGSLNCGSDGARRRQGQALRAPASPPALTPPALVAARSGPLEVIARAGIAGV